MTEPARSLPHAPTRPPLRAVPPPRGPSPAVIRRRRAVALGALLGMAGLPLALLLGTGGGSDRERITALLTAGASRPATLCDQLSEGLLQAAGGREACVAASPQRAPAGTVQDVRITGDTATAVVVRGDREEVFRLVREGGGWKVDDVG